MGQGSAVIFPISRKSLFPAASAVGTIYKVTSNYSPIGEVLKELPNTKDY